MAGLKRPSDGIASVKAKKSRVENRPSHPVDGTTTRKIKQATLPSPDDLSGVSKEDVDAPGTNFRSESVQLSKEPTSRTKKSGVNGAAAKPIPAGESFLNGSSSREAHAKQKVLVQERKAAKPNADSIARSKKIWERLRLKSHVPPEERKELVAELFGIITGRVKDFVFKHDSVRVIQTAVKYGNLEQRRQIAGELKGQYRALAESRYAKFLIAKLVVGSDEIRDMVVPEFYGHVKGLIRHPEAAWIMDDIYRTIATPKQKTQLLREWYGPEFFVFRDSAESAAAAAAAATAELSHLLAGNPEKRGPIMQHLKEMTHKLVQKKMSGFTMLHDALLQYFLNCLPGGPEANEVIQMLNDDEEGDLLKNLAFTKSGARLVCLGLAYSGSKDRRAMLKVYKGEIQTLAADPHGHAVLLTAYDVIDDTVMVSKAIFPELLAKDMDEEQRQQQLLRQIGQLSARIPLLYLLTTGLPKWLLLDQDIKMLREAHEIRNATSKKEPETRRQELVKAVSQPLIDLISQQTEALVASSFGCQFINEVIFGAVGDKTAALESLAALAKDTPGSMDGPHAGRMLKSLVQGGPYNKRISKIEVLDPPLRFDSILYLRCRDDIVSWATGPNSFVVVAMLESPNMEERDGLVQALRMNAPALQTAAKGSEKEKGNAGARMLQQKIDVEAMS